MSASDFQETIKYMPDDELRALYEQLYQRLKTIDYQTNGDYVEVSEQIIAVIKEEARRQWRGNS
jgi:hypothetical protein